MRRKTVCQANGCPRVARLFGCCWKHRPGLAEFWLWLRHTWARPLLPRPPCGYPSGCSKLQGWRRGGYCRKHLRRVLAACKKYAALGCLALMAGCYPHNIRTKCDPTQMSGSFDSCGPGGWLYPDAGVDAPVDFGSDLGIPPLPSRPPRPVTWCIR